ncbi:MAG: hypothetical protein WAU45_02710 [Blastocatellia bacterium]
MQYFNELGSLVEQRWKDQNYDEKVFPDIAAQALSDTDPNNHVSPWEIIRWLFTSTHIPGQMDITSEFGNPPVTVYTGPRFHIDVYFWLDGTTSTHQHAFCGAFHVLLGSSIHCRYTFRDRRPINQHFLVGRTVLESVDLLETGAIKRILAGEQYIHSLFHLDRPSATICVRTYHTASGAPQYNYRRPYFGIDPFFKEPLLIKQVRSASLLLKMQHPDTDALLCELLARADFQTTFTILDTVHPDMTGNWLEKSFGVSKGEQRFEGLLEIARRRHGELVDLIFPVFEETQRQHNLVYRRELITSYEHRFFLALLLNVPDRVKVLELVKQRFPDRDPVETITDWVDELAKTRVMGSAEANVLGINHFDDDYLLVFQCMLEGLTVEQIKSRFEGEFSAEDMRGLGGKTEELYNSIRSSMLFKSIFLDQPSATTANRISDNPKLAAAIQSPSLVVTH